MARIPAEEARRESTPRRAALLPPADAFVWTQGLANLPPWAPPLPFLAPPDPAAYSPGAQSAVPAPARPPAATDPAADMAAEAEAAGTTPAEADPHLGVVPNSKAQQHAALAKPDLGVIFDTRIAPLLPEVVADRAGKLAAAEEEKRHRTALRKTNKQVDREIAALRRGPGRGPARAVVNELRQKAVRAVVRETVDPAALEPEQLARFRAIFLYRGGDVMDAREGGYVDLRKKLEKAEKKLVKELRTRTRRKPPAGEEEIQRRVLELRLEYQARLAGTIDRMVERFPVLARAELRAQFEPQPGVRALRGFGRPVAGREQTVPATGKPWGESSAKHQVGESLQRWVQHLRENHPQPFGATTYATHSWGAYSVDIGLRGTKTVDGFYPQQAAIDFLMAADASAKATRVAWRALYNDMDVAFEVNRRLGERRVTFQWHHGPAPYVLHFHFDIMPLDLPATMVAEEGACLDPGSMVCEGDDPPAFDDSLVDGFDERP